MFNYQQLMEEIKPAAIRSHARQQMRTAAPPFWVVTLVSMVLTALVPDGVKSFCPATTTSGELNGLGLFLSILMTLFVWVIDFGYTWWSLDCSDGVRPGITALFNGFSMVSAVLMLEIGVAARKFLWSLIISVPTAVLICSLLLTAAGDGASLVAMFLLVAIIYITYYVVSLRYALARCLLMDQEEGHRRPSRAIRDSVTLMRGWKMSFFKLQLSFFGWYLLVAALMLLALVLVAAVNLVSAGSLLEMLRGGHILMAIGSVQAVPAVSLAMVLLPLPLDLWLTPYTSVAAARFYRLRAELAQCPPPVYEEGNILN